MFTLIDSDVPIWLIVLAAMLISGVAVSIVRIRMRRRMRKKEWLASFDPITIDFTGQAGLTRQDEAKATTDGRRTVSSEKRALP